MVSDRNQIVGILALHAGLINPDQFATAVEACSTDSSIQFLEWFRSQAWIDGEGQARLERLLAEKMAALAHDPAATFAEAASLEHKNAENRSIGDLSTIRGIGTIAELGTVADQYDSQNDPHPTMADPDASHLPPRGTGFLRGPSPVSTNLSRLSAISGGNEGSTRYSRTHLHAKGGIGQVWLARDGDLGREVALKELRPEQTHSMPAWSRFLEEARITGQLEHPGIVPVYELATSPDDGKPFYTMRFIRGGTLHDAIRAYHLKRVHGTAGPLDLATLLSAFVAVCNAVGYAHSRGVIHRDLKGQNVVMGDFGEVMVLDWGLAKLVDQPEAASAGKDEANAGVTVGDEDSLHPQTIQGQVLGTPSYMAPEQAEGRLEAIDRRTDIYGLGAILYELLAGRPPYSGAATAEVLRKVREEPPAPPGEVVKGTAKPLEAICLKAMQKRPEDRYETALALADDVRRWIADEPVSAYPEPWPRRLGRWGKRHRSAVASAAAFLVAVTGVLSVATVLIGQERNEAKRQRAQARLAVDEMYTKVADQWLEDRLDPLQHEMLEKALHYYEGFTQHDASDPVVRLERGRAFLRLGDVLRKLGRHDQAEAAYRKSVEVLAALARHGQSGHRLEEANARARLASELALRASKANQEEAETLYLQALAIQQPLLDDQTTGALAVASSRIERGLAEVLRSQGKLKEAEAHYRQAILRGNLAEHSAPGSIDVGQELAAAYDGLGVLLRDQDRRQEAEAFDRLAISHLEPLVARAPNLPQLRDALAKAYNSLGLVVMESENLPDAEPILRRQVALNERLAEDFPARPEYRRTLARGLKNLGLLYRQTARPRDAEQSYRRALEINDKLVAESPEVRNFVRDQAICLNNLGELIMNTSRRLDADPLFDRAQQLYEKLAVEDAQVPAHRLAISGVLNNRGIWLRGSGKLKPAIASFQQAADRLEPLVVAEPANPSYRREQARALTNLGNAFLADGKPQDAENAFRKAVGRYEELVSTPSVPAADKLDYANCLSSRGANQTEGKLPGAEDSLRRSLALFDELSTKPPLSLDLRRKLAASRINLGDFLRVDHRWPEAEVAYQQAVGMLDALVLENSSVIDFQGDLADVLGGFGQLRIDQDRLADARDLFDRAAKAGRVVLAANSRHPTIRKTLGNHLATLSGLLVRLGLYADAAKAGDEMIRVSADIPGTRGEFARLMVRCMPLAENDPKLSPSRRTAMAGAYADRAIAQLREALENKEPGAEKLVEEEIFAPLRSRDGYKTLPLAALETAGSPSE